MTATLTLLILTAALVVTAALRWAAHRSGAAAPMGGRPFHGDRDAFRVRHDVDAIRTRFERSPAWPSSGALGERR